MALIGRAVRAGTLPEAALGSTLRWAPDRDEVFLTIDLEAGQDQWNPLVPAQHLAVVAEARACVQAVWALLRATLPAFAKAAPLQHPVHLGVRESACWRGDVTLKGKDLLASRRFDDEVALAGWPLELRETARGPQFRYFDKPEPAGIPAGCLRTRTLPGMFFAGRCLSADHEALASVRMMGTCLATGQGAGRLASVFAAKVASQ
jgi:hypothetical protein